MCEWWSLFHYLIFRFFLLLLAIPHCRPRVAGLTRVNDRLSLRRVKWSVVEIKRVVRHPRRGSFKGCDQRATYRCNVSRVGLNVAERVFRVDMSQVSIFPLRVAGVVTSCGLTASI